MIAQNNLIPTNSLDFGWAYLNRKIRTILIFWMRGSTIMSLRDLSLERSTTVTHFPTLRTPIGNSKTIIVGWNNQVRLTIQFVSAGALRGWTILSRFYPCFRTASSNVDKYSAHNDRGKRSVEDDPDNNRVHGG